MNIQIVQQSKRIYNIYSDDWKVKANVTKCGKLRECIILVKNIDMEGTYVIKEARKVLIDNGIVRRL